MPNDAKLGLLTGVIGVILVAAMSGKTPAALKPAPGPTPAASPVQSVQSVASEVTK